MLPSKMRVRKTAAAAVALAAAAAVEVLVKAEEVEGGERRDEDEGFLRAAVLSLEGRRVDTAVTLACVLRS